MTATQLVGAVLIGWAAVALLMSFVARDWPHKWL
jgi:hypothetical protein